MKNIPGDRLTQEYILFSVTHYVTSSEAVLPILSNMELAERKKDFWRDLWST